MPLISADEPLNHHIPVVVEKEEMDSEAQEAEIAFFVRKSKLLAITWHKRCHQLDKLMGLTTSDTPLSVVPESILEDSEISEPIFDDLSLDSGKKQKTQGGFAPMEVPAPIEADDDETLGGFADIVVPDTIEADVDETLGEFAGIELPDPLESAVDETLDPDLGFSMKGEATALGFPVRAELDELDLLRLEYDETKEFEPVVEYMMRSLLPRYFQLVRSFLCAHYVTRLLCSLFEDAPLCLWIYCVGL